MGEFHATLAIMVMVGVAVAVAAKSTFPANRFFGATGWLTLSLTGSLGGGGLGQLGHANHTFQFVGTDLMWSSTGALLLVAVAAYIQRAEHAHALAAEAKADQRQQ